LKYKKKFHKKRKPKGKEFNGLQVEVWNNNVELALKKLKRKVKDSNLMLELKKRSFYEKPSKIKREKKNLQKLRYKYKNIKENPNN
jgi:small subunit ribosomal protein S21